MPAGKRINTEKTEVGWRRLDLKSTFEFLNPATLEANTYPEFLPFLIEFR